MTLVNPFKKSKCPYCAKELYPGQCAIVSSRTGTLMRGAKNGFLWRCGVVALKGSKYTGELALRQCSGCERLLPRSFGRAESHTIAIIGDSGSGKSHYIASCIDQLRKGHAWQVIGCTRIVGQGNTDQNYRNAYYGPMYLGLEQLEATLSATDNVRDPLVYEVVFRQKSRLKSARMVNLLFYNSAGFDLRDPKRMVHFSHYVLSASAIIFLVDPLVVPGIVNSLPDHLKPPLGANVLERTVDVLNHIIQTFEQGLGLEPGATLRTPIAITISKSDLLKFVTKYSSMPLFLNDAILSNKLDPLGFETVNREVQELLQRVGDRELQLAVSSFENKNFFAVSATGWPPDASGKFPTIEPLRCLDPLLWALWKLRLIDDE